MKKNRWLNGLICLSFMVALLSLPGVAGKVRAAEGGNKSTVEKEPSATKSFAEEKKEFEKEAKEKLAEVDRKIDELKAKAEETGSKAKAEAKKGLRELKKKRTALKKDIRKLDASTKETWEAAKKKVNDAMADLEETYHKVASHFQSE